MGGELSSLTRRSNDHPGSRVILQAHTGPPPPYRSSPHHDGNPGPLPPAGATQLQTIEIPSGEFFPMWRAHMDSHLENTDLEISANSVWEFVLCDCRLQYVELLKLDGPVEVEFLSFGEEDTFLASPCDSTVQQLTWKVNNLGWIKVPSALDDNAHKIRLGNEWWIGLRNTFSYSIRSLVQYRLFADRFLRLFIVPITCEDYMRIIITTNMPSVLQLLSNQSKHSSVGARLLAHCLLSKPVGEFQATVQDVTNGTQEESETEVFEFLAAEDVEDASAQVESTSSVVTRRLTFCRSDSLKHEPTRLDSDTLPTNEDDSGVDCSKVTEKKRDDHVMSHSPKPTAPPLSEIEPRENSIPDAPSAPPPNDTRLHARDSPKSKPHYPKPGTELSLKPTAPPLSEIEPQQHSIPAAPSAPPLNDLHSGDIPMARPLPLLVRQSSTHHPGLSLGSHLFPHQKRTVQWMLDVEAEKVPPLFVPQATLFGEWYVYCHGFMKEMFHKTVDVIVPYNHKLAVGGLVAHPVGAGKTVIAAELIKQTLGQGVNIVLVPGHIIQQWQKELERFVPNIHVVTAELRTSRNLQRKYVVLQSAKRRPNVVLLPHSYAVGFAEGNSPVKSIYRLIIDEPQEIVSKPHLFHPLLQVECRYRWLLTATPTPLLSMMQLALGYEESQHSSLPYESMLSWFTHTRVRRDPPHLCLPVPPLRIHMKPVVLLWQETSVMHSYVIRDDLQAAVRLSSFFYFAHGKIRKDAAENALQGTKAYQSLNEWVESHHDILSTQLTEQKANLKSVEKRISKEKADYEVQKQASSHVPDGASVAHSDLEVDMNIEHMFDEDEPGVSLGLLRSRGTYRQNIANFERRLVFLSTISDTVTSDSECLICMNLMGGRVVSMLPCLHSFCATCAAKLFGRRNHTSCPVCRNNTHRREVCTFVCAEDVMLSGSSDYGELREKFGSKICAVIEQVAQILTDFPDDKILVFGQWHDLLRQLSSAMPKQIQHVFLDGSLSQRCKQIEDFRNRPSLRVMLLSSESQASGANLEVANHVIVIHPYCPANVSNVSIVPLAQAQTFEQQAIGRVLRFPQTKDVHVYRFYSLGTPEEELYAHWGWAGLSQTEQVCQ